ncbi:MAG: cation:proton antiporter [Candidatus Omnitrophica bacterium]|nr:cation:proton antiporter [Candidatus Omnitrophota bacterium]
MLESIGAVLGKFSSLHINILFLLGLALFGGTIGGRIFQKLRIPQVVGYITIGIIIGTSGLKIIDREVLTALQPFNYFALGLIGFMIGRELKKEVFIKHGRQLVNVLMFEGVTSFILVSIFVSVLGMFIFKDVKLACALGLLLGAISSATAPAATTDVLWEYKTRGPLTRTVLSIVALDDGLALLLFAFASSIASRLIGHAHESMFKLLNQPLYEIGGSIIIGVASGWLLIKILKLHTQREKILAFSLGTVSLALGLSLALHVDMLLAAMTLGMIIVNYAPETNKKMFELVEGFTPPIYILFFVLVGAKLDVSKMSLPIIILALVYLIGRSAGKSIGANLGARISKMPESVQKYLPLCLFSQAGVAIGLSIVAAQAFPDQIGNAIIIVITATTFVVQLIGPPLTKLAVVKAKEVGLNVTEEDLIQRYKVEDVMDANYPLISEDMKLPAILRVFSESNNYYYPVVAGDKRMLGIVSVDGIRHAFVATGLSDLVVAVDIIEPYETTVNPKSPLSVAKELLDDNDLNYLPVVEKGDKLAGFLERRALDKLISMKIMELQEHAKSLE